MKIIICMAMCGIICAAEIQYGKCIVAVQTETPAWLKSELNRLINDKEFNACLDDRFALQDSEDPTAMISQTLVPIKPMMANDVTIEINGIKYIGFIVVNQPYIDGKDGELEFVLNKGGKKYWRINGVVSLKEMKVTLRTR